MGGASLSMLRIYVNVIISVVGVVLLSAVGGQYVLAKANLEQSQCPLFGVERCPLLGGYKCTIYMVGSIGGTGFVRCTEVVSL